MPETTSNLLKSIGSHTIIAILTALITVSIALGSYRSKIDALINEASQTRADFKELSIALNDLRVQVAILSGEVRLNREEAQKNSANNR